MKIKVSVGVAVLLLFVGCSQKMDSENAAKVVRETFNLTEKDLVEVKGIAKEAGGVMLVKISINGTEVNSKMRSYDKGWQLDEVQNKLGGWIPVSSVKNQFDPTEKMKIAKEEIKLIGTVLSEYVLDHGKFSFEEAPSFYKEGKIYKTLCPQYVKSLPTTDPWGNLYQILCGKNIAGQPYGFPNGADNDFMIFSFGRDGKMEKWDFDPKNDKAGLYKEYDPDKDIVYIDGVFIRAPDTWETLSLSMITGTDKKK